jgi:hypothetical protein
MEHGSEDVGGGGGISAKFSVDEKRSIFAGSKRRSPWDIKSIDVRACRKCGCTENNCTQCVERTGKPCSWVDWDLCSACDGANNR